MNGLARALLMLTATVAAAWAAGALQGTIWRHGQTCNFDTGPLAGSYTGYVTATRESDDKQWTTEVFVDPENGYVRYRFPLPTEGGPEFNYWYRMTGMVGNHLLCLRRFYYSYGSYVCHLQQAPDVGASGQE